MDILFFIICAFLIGLLVASNSNDRLGDDRYPPRRPSRRPIVIDDYDDDYDEDYYYRRWRAGHRERTRAGALQHTLLFMLALVVGMLVYDGCDNKNTTVKHPESAKNSKY